MTIYEIKQASQEKAPKFFSRENLKFFGQTLKDFKVKKMENGKFQISAPRIDIYGKQFGETIAYFNPITKDIDTDLDD